MNDQELLELAAKAVGYSVVGTIVNTDGDVIGLTCKEPGKNLPRFRWCPLIENSDSFQLASKRMLIVDFGNCCVDHPVSTQVIDATELLAGTRRAIVLAAAKLGKAMP